ncbi:MULTISPECIES: glycosyltransferase [unclassified Providencia]|uniref:glycosyltransferase n=1 Tax=unclassified Providencia TaxID=2633465 RepID=UPI00234A12CE|nr:MULTISPECIES: glycosyltransferase [unclassified Providencia]
MKKEIISISVLSFNSSQTIIETLNSILAQDYGCQYIELIIGDDGSKDNTCELIRSWVDKNNHYFYSVKLNLIKQNKGLVFNYNSTCELATSEWLKPIAADDLLTENCLSQFYSYIIKNKQVSCVFCKVEKFNSNSSLGVFPKNEYYFNISANEQFKNLLVDNFLPAPAVFIKVSLLKSVEYFDNRMYMEDYPLWLKLTSMGIKLHLINEVLVKYRVGNSVSNSNLKLINEELNNDVYICKKEYLKKLKASILEKPLYYIDITLFKLNDIVKIKILKNKKNKLTTFISPAFRLLSPLFILRKIKNSN